MTFVLFSAATCHPRDDKEDRLLAAGWEGCANDSTAVLTWPFPAFAMAG